MHDFQELSTQAGKNFQDLFAHFRFAEVYHLAAYGVRSDENDLTEIINVNTLAAANLARTAIANRVKRFIYLGYTGHGIEESIHETVDEL